jgi:HPr kinase/phosphorylase
MPRTISIINLFELQQENLCLTWIAGQAGGERAISLPDLPETGLAGFYNPIHPHAIPLLTDAGLAWLAGQPDPAPDPLAPPAVLAIVTGNSTPPPGLVEHAERSGFPLFSSRLEPRRLINRLNFHLTQSLSARITVHGVFMEVLGAGVLLSGESGIGKSELALALLSRGHRLIADDAPEFANTVPRMLVGYCPEPLHDFLEVRGLGILNVRAMFGDSALAPEHVLDLVIHLKEMEGHELAAIDRLHGVQRHREMLGIEVPEVTIPVAEGRNLAVLVEAAVRNELLKSRGYDAGAEFIARQRIHIERGPA